MINFTPPLLFSDYHLHLFLSSFILQSENSTLLSENKNFKEGKETLELKEKAHVASQKLAGAAKDAEANLK